MPPNRPGTGPNARGPSSTSSNTIAVQRVYPFLTNLLVNSARLTQPLLLLSLLFNSKFLHRPPRQRAVVWYLAYLSFYSRHLLALLSLRILFAGVGRPPGRENGGNE